MDTLKKVILKAARDITMVKIVKSLVAKTVFLVPVALLSQFVLPIDNTLFCFISAIVFTNGIIIFSFLWYLNNNKTDTLMGIFEKVIQRTIYAVC